MTNTNVPRRRPAKIDEVPIRTETGAPSHKIQDVSYPSTKGWKEWKKDFCYGTLAFLPEGIFKKSANQLRRQFDPISAATSEAHITLTQPLKCAIAFEDMAQILKIAASTPVFQIQIGPVITSPNRKLLWFDIVPKDKILQLREALHSTGLFRTDLPLTTGFLPHLTISESPRDPGENAEIINSLNDTLKPATHSFDRISWIIPNSDFVFSEFMSFALSCGGTADAH